MSHPSDDLLTLHYYGEAPETEAVERHIEECGECRENYQHLQRILNSLDSAPVPERGAEYGAAVWRRLEPRLGPRPVRWWRHSAWALAAAAVIAVAFFAGSRFERHRRPVPVAERAEPGLDSRQEMLRVALEGHLASSLLVLSEIQNAPDARPGTDITWQRQSAEQLLGDNRLMKQTASQAREPRVKQLLQDLEEILLEIAHSPAEITPQQLDELRARIARKGIVFEIRILSAEPPLDKGIL